MVYLCNLQITRSYNSNELAHWTPVKYFRHLSLVPTAQMIDILTRSKMIHNFSINVLPVPIYQDNFVFPMTMLPEHLTGKEHIFLVTSESKSVIISPIIS